MKESTTPRSASMRVARRKKNGNRHFRCAAAFAALLWLAGVPRAWCGDLKVSVICRGITAPVRCAQQLQSQDRQGYRPAWTANLTRIAMNQAAAEIVGLKLKYLKVTAEMGAAAPKPGEKCKADNAPPCGPALRVTAIADRCPTARRNSPCSAFAPKARAC